jgi:membrane protein DedA with SNARE-associated domain
MGPFEEFVDLYGLPAMALVLLTKSAGVPVPVPADALMVLAAARVAAGALVLWEVFLVLLAALVVGGTGQFLLARGPARGLLYRSGRYLGLTPARLDAASARVAGAGPAAIAVGVLLPGVRAVTVAGCGLAGVPLRRFLPGLLVGSALFLAVHFLLGFAAQVALLSLGRVGVPLGWPLVVGLALVGLAAWFGLRQWQRPGAPAADVVAETAGAWQEATCPVCLMLGAIGPVFPIAHEEHVGAAAGRPAGEHGQETTVSE